jgi:deoxyribose-phosphate aldolase
MKDLEIRGAGDLLGGEQSGFINDIGFETYQKILAEAIDELKENEFKDLYEEVEGHKEVCGDIHLKVILETGELVSPENIFKASKMVISAGADFIKTSTGKIHPAATLEASFVMLTAIKEHYEGSGKMIGFKPAGGISEPEDAVKYYSLVKSILGEKWLDKDLFRIRASRLADKIFSKIS